MLFNKKGNNIWGGIKYTFYLMAFLLRHLIPSSDSHLFLIKKLFERSFKLVY